MKFNLNPESLRTVYAIKGYNANQADFEMDLTNLLNGSASSCDGAANIHKIDNKPKMSW